MFSRFTVIPAIDLKGGKVVRLLRGAMDQATTYGEDPAAVAREFAAAGAEQIHLVDLDGAIAGEPRNLASIASVRAAVRCRLDVGGGLRSPEAIRRVIAAGADLISIGSAAFLDPALLEQACAEFPGRVLGSLDARDGRIAIKGWVETSALTIDEAFARFRKARVAAVAYTDVARDGTEAGVNADAYAEAASIAGLPLIASGGVASLEDVRRLARLYSCGIVGVIVGRALYERRFSLSEAIAAAGG